MQVEADFSGDDETVISYEEFGCGGEFQLCFRGAGQDLFLQLSYAQYQKLTDLLATWGYEPSEESKAELEKIKLECQ